MKRFIFLALCLMPYPALADYEYYSTPYSSFVNGAEYDTDTGTMTIDINGRTYQYDNVSEDDWSSFKASPSAGKGYNSHIKRNYDYSTKW